MTLRARLGQPAIADHEEIRPVGRATLAGNGRRRARFGGLGLSSLRVNPRPGTGRCQCGLRLAGWAGGFSSKHIWRCAARQRGSWAWSESSGPRRKQPRAPRPYERKAVSHSNFIQTTELPSTTQTAVQAFFFLAAESSAFRDDLRLLPVSCPSADGAVQLSPVLSASAGSSASAH